MAANPKRLSILSLVILVLLIACGGSTGDNPPMAEAGEKRELTEVPIVYPVSVDALLAIGRGADEALAEEGLRTRPFSAEGDAGRFSTAVEAALSTGSPVVITVGTQITNTALGPKYLNDRPSLVAAAIFDPPKLETIDTAQLPRETDIAIVSDHPEGSGEQLVKLGRILFPEMAKIGILANRAELNSMASGGSVEAAAQLAGLEVEWGFLSSPADLTPVTRTLLSKGVDALVIPHDKIAVAQAASVVQLALGSDQARPVPVLSMDNGTVEQDGVLACVSADYEAVGRHAGRMVLAALAGEELREIEVLFPPEVVVAANAKTARQLGVTLPEDSELPLQIVGP